MFKWLTSRLFPIWVPIRIVKFYNDLNNTKETFTHTTITYVNFLLILKCITLSYIH